MTDVGKLEPWEARALVQLGMVRAAILSEKSAEASRQRRSEPMATPTFNAATGRRSLPAPPSFARRR
jgi:hypothetical protein